MLKYCVLEYAKIQKRTENKSIIRRGFKCENGVLVDEGSKVLGAGSGGVEETRGEGLECDYCVGVRVEEGEG